MDWTFKAQCVKELGRGHGLVGLEQSQASSTITHTNAAQPTQNSLPAGQKE